MLPMKFKIVLLLFIIAIINTATTCDDNIDISDPILVNLTGIEASNVNNEGVSPFPSDKPIKKEAYMLSLKYLTDEADNTYYNSLKDTIKSIKIFNLIKNGEHVINNDITDYFIKTTYCLKGDTWGFVLRKPMEPGEYNFKIMLTTNSKVFEASANPIELY